MPQQPLQIRAKPDKPLQTLKKPYIGPFPFERSKNAVLYGRGQESNELFYIILANKLVLFYAQSGAGKSSLINAKLIPDLEAYGVNVYPVGRVGGPNLDLHNQEINPFTYYLMLNILEGTKLDHQQDQRLKRYSKDDLTGFFKYLNFKGGQIEPNMEMFQPAGGSSAARPASTDLSQPKVLFIDQFEEIITTNLAHWDKRADFFGQIQRLLEAEQTLRVVFVMREEYVVGIGPYANAIPGGIRNRFYMQLLDEQAAREAITEPLKNIPQPEPAAAKLISENSGLLIENLRLTRIPGTDQTFAGEFIDPVQLQIVCYQLWENLTNKSQTEISTVKISEAADVETALESFYNASVRFIVDQASFPEKSLRDWIGEKLITEDKRRNILKQDTAGLPEEVFKLLMRRYILRPAFYLSSGETLFELAHDRLIQPILRSNEKWNREHSALSELPKFIKDNLHLLEQAPKGSQASTDRVIKIPIFILEPDQALKEPAEGVKEIAVRLEAGMSDGPVSSRLAVVDLDFDTQATTKPVAWDRDVGWFHTPGSESDWLPYAIEETSRSKDASRQMIAQMIENPYFHQVNVWAVAQRVLDFYEDPLTLGRRIPWGFEDNRLYIAPHAGFGTEPFYDRLRKMLKFFYSGDPGHRSYTCLSHDLIARLTSQAILDGIRPLYSQPASLQTAAFHEFIGDLTAILLVLLNEDVRQPSSEGTRNGWAEQEAWGRIRYEIHKEIGRRPYLGAASNYLTLQDLQDSIDQRDFSLLMTGAMLDILVGIAVQYQRKLAWHITELQALVWAAEQFRRVALQPLDLCPPCDIQFIDYARAVVRNDILTNPLDELGCQEIMLRVFHQRGLCTCGYKSGKDLPEGCQFQEATRMKKLDFVFHDIRRVSGSRTAAYYFLNDNRKPLRIPAYQDVRVLDLYDTNKFDAATQKWLPRQFVLAYAWREKLVLQNDPQKYLYFDRWHGKSIVQNCGGTLVFDELGNLLSWFRNPGTEYLTDAQEADIRQRLEAWKTDPTAAMEQGIRRLTLEEQSQLADLDAGRQRKAVLLQYLAENIRPWRADAPEGPPPSTRPLRSARRAGNDQEAG